MKSTNGKDTTVYGQLTLWPQAGHQKLRHKRYGVVIVRFGKKKEKEPKPPRDGSER